MHAKSEKRALLSIAALHLTGQVTHGYSHVVEGIQNTPLQLVFILLVITIAPLLAVYIAWESKLRTGAGLFALSMIAAFLFGYSLHFVIDSPDFHSNVVGEYARVFFHSALNLAIVEFVGFVFGAYIWLVPRDGG